MYLYSVPPPPLSLRPACAAPGGSAQWSQCWTRGPEIAEIRAAPSFRDLGCGSRGLGGLGFRGAADLSQAGLSEFEVKIWVRCEAGFRRKTAETVVKGSSQGALNLGSWASICTIRNKLRIPRRSISAHSRYRSCISSPPCNPTRVLHRPDGDPVVLILVVQLGTSGTDM